MFGSPKSKSTPPKTSLDDSMDSSTSSSHDDSYANLTPYGAYTPLAVKIQRYAAELSGKLKDELDITMDDTTFGESNGSSNSSNSPTKKKKKKKKKSSSALHLRRAD